MIEVVCHQRGEYVAIIPFFVNDHGFRALKLAIRGIYTGKQQVDRDSAEIKSEQKQDQTNSKAAENQTNLQESV